jgi:murein DD-endopeptidase MepM/ murein hydrolase activator NlpD
MAWYRRRSWSAEQLMRTGAFAGALALLVCVTTPPWSRAAAAPPSAAASPHPEAPPSGPVDPRPLDLLFPVPAVTSSAMANSFDDRRGVRVHHAVDILAPRHSDVVAVTAGTIARMISSVAGGIAVYQWNADKSLVFYYAHLQSYAPGLAEGQAVRVGQVLGYVGTTGNAPKNTPHLHFAISRVERENQWWGGAPVNPYPIWR